MPRILIVADQVDSFQELACGLNSVPDVETLWARDGESALTRIAADSPDLVIVDEAVGEVSGLEWIRRLMAVNAFIPAAAVSSLPHDMFHEASEGLGIMAQLPLHPGRSEAEQLLKTLHQLTRIK